MKWVLFVLEGAGVRGLPVLAAVLCHLRHGMERGLAGAVLPWHVRAAEVTVRGKRLDTQLCRASLELKCL